MASRSQRRRERRRRTALRHEDMPQLLADTAQLPPTSYTSTGTTQKPPAEELTESGVADVQGPLREYVPELIGRVNQVRMWRRMQWNDAQVKAMVTLVKTPGLAGDYYIEAAGSDAVDVQAAEFAAYNLFANMTTSWPKVLFEISQMFPYGSSALERVHEWNEWAPGQKNANRKKYIMLRKMAPRPAWTIKNYTYDANGGPAGLIQTVKDPSNPQSQPQDVPIDISKLAIFVNEQDGGSLDGTSILRPAYKHWFYKDNFYKIDGIQKERHGIGIPRVKTPPGVTQTQKNNAKQLGRQLRTNEEGQIVQPYGWEIDFVKLEGQLTNALESAREHDLMIMRSILGQFINAGAGSDSGGRATAGSHVDMFLKSARFSAEYVCEIINLYVIAPLVMWNFPVQRFPKLKVRRIGERRDSQMWTAALKNATDAGLLTPTYETEVQVRKELDLEQLPREVYDSEQAKKDAMEKAKAQPPNDPGQPGDQPGDGKGPGRPGSTGNVGKPDNAAD